MKRVQNAHRLSRRTLFRSMAVTATAATVATQASTRQAPSLERGSVILFQGDSITDCGRDRPKQSEPNNPAALGTGYPYLLSCQLLRDHPRKGLKLLNRGISGDQVPDLEQRWSEDTLDLEPSLLSILIGVNDIWHSLDGDSLGTVEDYERGLLALLRRTQQAIPGVTIVLCEPFVLRCGAVDDRWFPEFDHRRQAAARVARETGAVWVAFQSGFDEVVAKGTEPAYWAEDGVHPSMAGHSLMAKIWREAVGI